MDMIKMGNFLMMLRKEKGLTQEQFADLMNVSSRTVSRWETGRNMPDLTVLIEISDYHHVDLREILDGERKSSKMNQELEDTVLKVADYSNEEKNRFNKRAHNLFLAGCICSILYFFTLGVNPNQASALFGFIQGMLLGIMFGLVILGFIITSKDKTQILSLKRKIFNKKSKNK